MGRHGGHMGALHAGMARWAHRVRRASAGGLLGLVGLGLAGCATDAGSAGADPLLGAASARPMAQAAGPPPGTATPLPRLPAPASLTSTAALASGTPAVPDSGQDLRIADAYRRPEVAPPGATVLRPPEGVFQPVATPGTLAGAAPITYEQAEAKLVARGATWQRLETTGAPAEWKFTCSVPNPQNPTINRTYEARGRDPVSAIHAVVQQIDKER